MTVSARVRDQGEEDEYNANPRGGPSLTWGYLNLQPREAPHFYFQDSSR